MKHLKKFNEDSNDLINLDINGNEEPLSIEEFQNLREAMYAVKTSDSPSAFQAKEFFKNSDNFDKVIEKLRKILLSGS
jgi:hypothetical protein